MRILLNICVAATVSLFAVGCSSTSRFEKEHSVVTEIISDPPGARIEINGDYIGETPLETRIRNHPGDKVVMGKVTIRALPTKAGHYVQSMILQGPQFMFDPHRDVVPKKIFFDMSLSGDGGGTAVSPSYVPPKSGPTKSGGTGFFVSDDGYLLTNAHVVDGATSITVLVGDAKHAATIVSIDAQNDLAVLRIDGVTKGLVFANSNDVGLGASVFTIGFPLTDVQGVEPKLTRGEISSLKGLRDSAGQFQISAPVQPGNSGGPLVLDDGRVTGVIVSKLSELSVLVNAGTLPQNVNYAIKSSYVLAFLQSVDGLVFHQSQEPRKVTSFEDTVQLVLPSVVRIEATIQR